MGLEGSQSILKQNSSVIDQIDILSYDFEYIELRFTFMSEGLGTNQ